MKPVMVTGCPDSGWEMLVPLLRQLLPASVEIGSIDQVISASAPQAEQRYLLCYVSAHTALAHAMHQGLEPEEALANWQAVNRQLLTFQRRQRRCVLLIDAERACAYPTALTDALQRVELVDDAPDTFAACEPSASSPPVAFEVWLAKQWLGRHAASISQLETELEASGLALPSLEATGALDPEALWSLYRGWQARLSDLTQARDAQVSRAEALQQQIDEQTQAVAERQKQIEALTAEKADLSEENELLLSQLHQVQEELEKIFIQSQTLTQERDEQTQAVAERQKQIEALTAEKVDLSEENELLLSQLHQVQEELENYFLKNQALEPELHAHRVGHERLNMALMALARARDGLAEQLEDAQQQFQQREHAFDTERQVNRLARQQLTNLIARLDTQARHTATLEAQAATTTEQPPIQAEPPPAPLRRLPRPPLIPVSRKQFKRDKDLLATSPHL